MNKDYSSKPYDAGPPGCRINPGTGILNWDSLIPVPPARPSRRIRARINHIGRDKPSPVPEDDIPLSGLEDL